ncbi:MAG: universal stress protein [Zavarzinella sp.]
MAIQWEKILVATDLSKESNNSVDYAHNLAETLGAELHVLHVVEDISQMAQQYGVTGVIEPGQPQSAYDQWLAGLLGETGKIRRVEVVRLGDDPVDVITNYAKSNEISLIVIATHGRTGLREIIMGSVAQGVVKYAPCPVLVIRAS